MNKQNIEIPDWKLERLVLGILDEAEDKHIRKMIEEAPDIQKRLQAIEESNKEILEKYPPVSVAKSIEQRAHKKQRKQQAVLNWSISAAACACLLAVLIIWLPKSHRDDPVVVEHEITRLKGLQPKLMLHRKLASGSELLGQDHLVREGDLLQISYRASGNRFGMIFSIDGHGNQTLHWPRKTDQEPSVKPSSEVFLPFSYELDDAPGFERFFLVTSKEMFEIRKILKAADLLSSKELVDPKTMLNLPEDFMQHSIVLRKAEQ
jgi:hypothetical protein